MPTWMAAGRASLSHQVHGGAVAPQLSVSRQQQHRFGPALAHQQPTAALEWQASCLGWLSRELMGACPLEGFVSRSSMP